ncbi:Inositol polyphosphate kinase [Babesia microti strain RI]|uniref:Kinase n=1 Tax=Babesia microti (strain RI) TaxID=1133968 RepID=I7IHN0_BABMR|nr:Inositol polyphosphate kinase [Babesia microti strain RI]CCF76097.1 Inositol polyphosphate kinase [Babesia microti strain RI]|eukprot:XP_012650505.1 Inositol polyphosphate kinase [Babesia microti strain RI]
MAKRDDYPKCRRLKNHQLSSSILSYLHSRTSRATTPSSPTDSTTSTVSTVTTVPLLSDEQESIYYLLKSFAWNLWVGPLPIHSLPIAGGHENQWLLPKGVSELGQVAKLTCLNEAYFYYWIYRNCGKVLPLHNTLLECTGKVLRSLKGKNINNMLTKSVYSRQIKNSKYRTVHYDVVKSLKSENKEVITTKNHKIVCTNAAEGLNDITLHLSKENHLHIGILNLHNLIPNASHIVTMFKYLPPCYNLCIEDGMAAITLENVTHGMGKPVVMDLKMGTRLFSGDCTDESVIRSKEEKAMQRSTKTHGFHISGMYVWDKLKRLASFLPVNLAHATKDDLLLLIAFEKFFYLPLEAASRQKLLSKFVSLLTELRKLFQNQLGLVFYGSSLLFIYDSASSCPWITAKVYMIDFAHVAVSDVIDEGYLKGLDNLIRLFYILSHTEATQY